MAAGIAGLDGVLVVLAESAGAPSQPKVRSTTQRRGRILKRVSLVPCLTITSRGPRPRDQWTRKVRGKTVRVALSQAQYEWLRGHRGVRQVQATLKAMQQLSRRVLFAPHVVSSKPTIRLTPPLAACP